jgi:putative transposase
VSICRREQSDEKPPLTVSERARLRELERETRELKMENEFLKKSQHTSPATIGDREVRVHRRGGCSPTRNLLVCRCRQIVKMCRWMEVSWSGFYEWRNAPESAAARRRGMLALIVTNHLTNRTGLTGPGGSARTW